MKRYTIKSQAFPLKTFSTSNWTFTEGFQPSDTIKSERLRHESGVKNISRCKQLRYYLGLPVRHSLSTESASLQISIRKRRGAFSVSTSFYSIKFTKKQDKWNVAVKSTATEMQSPEEIKKCLLLQQKLNNLLKTLEKPLRYKDILSLMNTFKDDLLPHQTPQEKKAPQKEHIKKQDALPNIPTKKPYTRPLSLYLPQADYPRARHTVQPSFFYPSARTTYTSTGMSGSVFCPRSKLLLNPFTQPSSVNLPSVTPGIVVSRPLSDYRVHKSTKEALQEKHNTMLPKDLLTPPRFIIQSQDKPLSATPEEDPLSKIVLHAFDNEPILPQYITPSLLHNLRCYMLYILAQDYCHGDYEEAADMVRQIPPSSIKYLLQEDKNIAPICSIPSCIPNDYIHSLASAIHLLRSFPMYSALLIPLDIINKEGEQFDKSLFYELLVAYYTNSTSSYEECKQKWTNIDNQEKFIIIKALHKTLKETTLSSSMRQGIQNLLKFLQTISNHRSVNDSQLRQDIKNSILSALGLTLSTQYQYSLKDILFLFNYIDKMNIIENIIYTKRGVRLLSSDSCLPLTVKTLLMALCNQAKRDTVSARLLPLFFNVLSHTTIPTNERNIMLEAFKSFDMGFIGDSIELLQKLSSETKASLHETCKFISEQAPNTPFYQYYNRFLSVLHPYFLTEEDLSYSDSLESITPPQYVNYNPDERFMRPREGYTNKEEEELPEYPEDEILYGKRQRLDSQQGYNNPAFSFESETSSIEVIPDPADNDNIPSQQPYPSMTISDLNQQVWEPFSIERPFRIPRPEVKLHEYTTQQRREERKPIRKRTSSRKRRHAYRERVMQPSADMLYQDTYSIGKEELTVKIEQTPPPPPPRRRPQKEYFTPPQFIQDKPREDEVKKPHIDDISQRQDSSQTGVEAQPSVVPADESLSQSIVMRPLPSKKLFPHRLLEVLHQKFKKFKISPTHTSQESYEAEIIQEGQYIGEQVIISEEKVLPPQDSKTQDSKQEGDSLKQQVSKPLPIPRRRSIPQKTIPQIQIISPEDTSKGQPLPTKPSVSSLQTVNTTFEQREKSKTGTRTPSPSTPAHVVISREDLEKLKLSKIDSKMSQEFSEPEQSYPPLFPLHKKTFASFGIPSSDRVAYPFDYPKPTFSTFFSTEPTAIPLVPLQNTGKKKQDIHQQQKTDVFIRKEHKVAEGVEAIYSIVTDTQEELSALPAIPLPEKKPTDVAIIPPAPPLPKEKPQSSVIIKKRRDNSYTKYKKSSRSSTEEIKDVLLQEVQRRIQNKLIEPNDDDDATISSFEILDMEEDTVSVASSSSFMKVKCQMVNIQEEDDDFEIIEEESSTDISKPESSEVKIPHTSSATYTTSAIAVPQLMEPLTNMKRTNACYIHSSIASILPCIALTPQEEQSEIALGIRANNFNYELFTRIHKLGTGFGQLFTPMLYITKNLLNVDQETTRLQTQEELTKESLFKFPIGKGSLSCIIADASSFTFYVDMLHASDEQLRTMHLESTPLFSELLLTSLVTKLLPNVLIFDFVRIDKPSKPEDDTLLAIIKQLEDVQVTTPQSTPFHLQLYCMILHSPSMSHFISVIRDPKTDKWLLHTNALHHSMPSVITGTKDMLSVLREIHRGNGLETDFRVASCTYISDEAKRKMNGC